MSIEELPGEILTTGALRFARTTGSSIAGRDAAPWVIDFLNGAYYRRPVEEREVGDLPAYHRAFGRERFDTAESGRGRLSRAQLLAGAGRLVGEWFEQAYADDERRGCESSSRARTSARPTTPPGAWSWRACTSSPPRARRRRSRCGTPTVRMPSPEAVIAASRPCAPAGSTARRSRSRSPPAPRPGARSSRAAT